MCKPKCVDPALRLPPNRPIVPDSLVSAKHRHFFRVSFGVGSEALCSELPSTPKNISEARKSIGVCIFYCVLIFIFIFALITVFVDNFILVDLFYLGIPSSCLQFTGLSKYLSELTQQPCDGCCVVGKRITFSERLVTSQLNVVDPKLTEPTLQLQPRFVS